MGLARWLAMGQRDYSEPLITLVKLSGVLAAPLGRMAPGGAPVQADLIYRLIRRLSAKTGVRVLTFAEDVAASGGYWLLCAGDKVHALEGSIVGSIGVISATFGAPDALARVGVERRVYTAGEAKAQLDPFLPVQACGAAGWLGATTPRPQHGCVWHARMRHVPPTRLAAVPASACRRLQPEQEARLRSLMGDLHETFKQRVKDSRGARLSGPEVELFSGRAWTGRQARALGLVDELADVCSAVQQEYGEKARLVLCSPAPGAGPFGGLFGSWGGAGLLRGGGEGGGAGWGVGGDGDWQNVPYQAWRAGIEAAMDVAEERALWGRFKVQ
eukprot:scaffold22.g6118.t1